MIGKKELKLEEIARQETVESMVWGESEGLKYLKDRIRKAVPSCSNYLSPKPALNGVYRCGDYFGLPSIDAAMKSGRLTAESIIKENQADC